MFFSGGSTMSTDGQPHRQIQLVGGALAQHLNAAGVGSPEGSAGGASVLSSSTLS